VFPSRSTSHHFESLSSNRERIPQQERPSAAAAATAAAAASNAAVATAAARHRLIGVRAPAAAPAAATAAGAHPDTQMVAELPWARDQQPPDSSAAAANFSFSPETVHNNSPPARPQHQEYAMVPGPMGMSLRADVCLCQLLVLRRLLNVLTLGQQLWGNLGSTLGHLFGPSSNYCLGLENSIPAPPQRPSEYVLQVPQCCLQPRPPFENTQKQMCVFSITPQFENRCP
jgi:hypothetical protein